MAQGDVEFHGPWTMAIQPDTPVHFLGTEAMSQYLMKKTITVEKDAHSGVSRVGVVFHLSEENVNAADGITLWMNVHHDKNIKQYMLGGQDLASEPVVTSEYVYDGQPETWEILVQGYHGVIFVRNRKVRINFQAKKDHGFIAFYNCSKCPEDDVQLDAVFDNVSITCVNNDMNVDTNMVPGSSAAAGMGVASRNRLGPKATRNMTCPGAEIGLKNQDRNKIADGIHEKRMKTQRTRYETQIELTLSGIEGLERRIAAMSKDKKAKAAQEKLQKELDFMEERLAHFQDALSYCL